MDSAIQVSQKSNGKYHEHKDPDKESSMAPPRKADIDDVLEILKELSHDRVQRELERQQEREIFHRIADNLDKAKAGGGWLQYAISLALVVAGWIYSGVVVVKNTESELKVSSAVADERYKNLQSSFEEFKKDMSRTTALLDERARSLEIAMKALERRK